MMSGLDTATILVFEMICGAAGAVAAARLWPGMVLGWRPLAVIGMAGGLVFTMLAARIPGIGRFVGHVEQAANTALAGAGGLTLGVLVGVGVAGLLGGVIAVSLVGLAKRGSGSH